MMTSLFEEKAGKERMSSRRVLLTVSLLAGLPFVVGVRLGEGSAVHGMLAAGAFGLAIVLLFGFIVVECVNLAFRQELRSNSWAFWLLLLAPLAGLFLSYAFFSIPNERRVAATRKACEDLILRLENHRRVSGSYPEHPEAWMDPERLGIEYVSDEGLEYRLSFQESLEDLSGPLNHAYESANATWSVSD
jgi:hypothetical protein